MRAWPVLLFLLLALAFVLISHRASRGDELPPGITCKYIREITVAIGADLRWDRERARAIAATYGVALTEVQLDKLQRCFP